MPYFLILYLNNLQLHSWIIPHFFSGKDILVSATFYIKFYKILDFFKLIFQVLIMNCLCKEPKEKEKISQCFLLLV